MIRLTLNALTDPEIHLFNKASLLLGSDSSQVDILLPGTSIQAIHLKIIEQNGFPVLINSTNDPFVSLNGHPFGKKLLNSGDVIVVHQTTLLFENLSNHVTKDGQLKEESLALLLEDEILKEKETASKDIIDPLEKDIASFSSFALSFEQEVEALKEEDLNKGTIDDYVNHIDKNHTNISLPSQSLLEKTDSPPRKHTSTLKDDYLRDLDDDNHKNNSGPFGHLSEPSHLYQAWKWILLFIFSLLAIAGIIGTVIYFSVSDKSEAQETKAAQAVADVAMALTYVQLNHFKPHNQNWSDIDFLKNHLQTVLQDTSSYAGQLDAQGQLNCCPYNLRIYTSTDLSHFLLIAQPNPTLLYWLIPRSIIVVDSNLMELRTLKDVRILNRLLANANPLEGMNGKEITQVVKQGELIRLSSLANESGNQDFNPPKNLAWAKPGAENYIYNAPRYYRLGQTLIQKATSLSTSKSSSQDVTNFKQEIESFNWLNHLILYSDQGKKSALSARQGFLTFAPNDKILFGYLLFNAQGRIHQVHLLKDDDEWKDSSLNPNKEGDIIAFQPISETAQKEKLKADENPSLVDVNHPIYIQIQHLIHARENELKPLSLALHTLIQQELQCPCPQFQIKFQNLSHSYLMANTKHKNLIKDNLEILFHQYEGIPIHQFLAFIKEFQLEQMIQPDETSFSFIDENCQQNIQNLLTQIENNKSLTELHNLIHIASSWLNFDYIKDPQELIKYQNLLRNHLLTQLEKYLLSPKKHELVKPYDKEILEDLLNQERLIKTEEKDFFLEEFKNFTTQYKEEDMKDIEQTEAISQKEID